MQNRVCSTALVGLECADRGGFDEEQNAEYYDRCIRCDRCNGGLAHRVSDSGARGVPGKDQGSREDREGR